MRTAQKRRWISSWNVVLTLSVSNQDVDETEQPVEDKDRDTEKQRRERIDGWSRKRKEALFNKSEPDDRNSGHSEQAFLNGAQIPDPHVRLSWNE